MVINPKPLNENKSRQSGFDDEESRKEWAKYKSYFLTILKKKLSNSSSVNILFVDDDNTNTKEANKLGFDTLTKISQNPGSIGWTIKGLNYLKTKGAELTQQSTDGAKSYRFDPKLIIMKLIEEAAEAAVTGLPLPATN